MDAYSRRQNWEYLMTGRAWTTTNQKQMSCPIRVDNSHAHQRSSAGVPQLPVSLACPRGGLQLCWDPDYTGTGATEPSLATLSLVDFCLSGRTLSFVLGQGKTDGKACNTKTLNDTLIRRTGVMNGCPIRFWVEKEARRPQHRACSNI